MRATGAELVRAAVAALLGAAAAASLAACGGRGDEQASAQPVESTAAPRADHKNIAYSIAGQTVRLVDGVAETPAAPGSAARIVTRYFGNEVRGDLNGDGREDVAFLLTQQPGGSGTFFYAAAALDLPSGLVGSQGLLIGDRIAPQTTELRPDGVIVVNYADRAPDESFATRPSLAKTILLKLNPTTMRLGEVAQDFEGEADPKSMKLDMKTWTWVRAVQDGNEIVPRQPEAFTLTFGADSTFSATTDCNRVRGGYTAEGSGLTFAEAMIATRMFCADAQEQVFTDLLRKTAGYGFTSRGELVLQLAGGAGSATFR
jgi:heat shock protein HslJ